MSQSSVPAQDGLTNEWDLEGDELGLTMGLPNGLDNDVRFRWDLSNRGVHKAGVKRTGILTAFGADFHKVFSSPKGDIGTLRLQGYMLHADGLPSTPGFFDDDHDWEWTYRFFDFNYTRFASKGVNVRLGHFEVPYGLEQTQTTNGTLRDYFSKTNLGLKADWGVSMNGQLPEYEYEIGLTRGSGNYYHDLEENYVFAGRAGTPREENLSLGASFMAARLPSDSFLRRERIGLDVVWTLPMVTVLAEASTGKNDETDLTTAMVEVNCSTPNEHGLAYAQLFGTDTKEISGHNDKYWAAIGVQRYVGDGVVLSAQWNVDLDALEGEDRSEAFMFQVRYRF